MITLILEALLGAVLVVVLMQLFRKRSDPPKPSVPQVDLANLKPTDARTGDVISVAGAGDNMTDLDFTTDRCTWYQAGAHAWFELSGVYRERRAALRVANEEEVEVALQSDPRKLTLDNLGLSEDDLAQMDERQNTSDSFEFDKRVWLYRMSREVEAKRDDHPKPAGFYYWEFREQDGRGLLGLRKPEGEPFLITLFEGIIVGDVTVYRRG